MTHASETTISASSAGAMRRISWLTLGVAVVLVAMKGAGWWWTDSVALLGSLLDSAVDLLVSSLNFFVIRYSLRPASRRYRFGRGKVEPLAAIIQSGMIGLSAAFLAWETVQRFITPQPVPYGALGIGVVAASLGLTIWLARSQARVVQSTGSMAVAAEHAHYRGDIYMNLGVMAAIGFAAYTPFIQADVLFGFAVVLVLCASATRIFLRALQELLDRELPEPMREQIRAAVLAHPEVSGMHDLRTRASGVRHFIQCHIEMDGTMTLHKAHTIADEVEASLVAIFPDAEIIIHQDPAGEETPPRLPH